MLTSMPTGAPSSQPRHRLFRHHLLCYAIIALGAWAAGCDGLKIKVDTPLDDLFSFDDTDFLSFGIDTDTDTSPTFDPDDDYTWPLDTAFDTDSNPGVEDWPFLDAGTPVDAGQDGLDSDAGASDSGAFAGPPACMILSEYIEGTSRNKGIELFNCGEGPIDLGPYTLCLISNTNDSCSVTLHLGDEETVTTMAPGDTLTICHPQATEIGPCTLHSQVANFNGDDRLLLQKAGRDIDAFGRSDTQPEEYPWADLTLRRSNFEPFLGILPFTVNDYFTAHPVDDFSDFGIPPIESTEAPTLDAGV